MGNGIKRCIVDARAEARAAEAAEAKLAERAEHLKRQEIALIKAVGCMLTPNQMASLSIDQRDLLCAIMQASADV